MNEKQIDEPSTNITITFIALLLTVATLAVVSVPAVAVFMIMASFFRLILPSWAWDAANASIGLSLFSGLCLVAAERLKHRQTKVLILKTH